MRDEHQISQMVPAIERDRVLKAIYGHIVDILSISDQDYYIPLVVPEESAFPIDTQSQYIPLDDPPEQLAANYGSPKDLIGLRVRIEYYGNRWRTGVGRIAPNRQPQSVGNLLEVPSRGFRFAVAGGGGV